MKVNEVVLDNMDLSDQCYKQQFTGTQAYPWVVLVKAFKKQWLKREKKNSQTYIAFKASCMFVNHKELTV